jgi:hypothetical protein
MYSYTSSSIQDGKEIPTANFMFSGSRNSITLSGWIDVVTESQKFKKAAAKSDVLVSQLIYKMAKKFQLLSACFRGRETK